MKSKLLLIATVALQSVIFFLLPLMGGMRGDAQSFQWANGIGSSFDDFGRSLAVDDSGNAYVTGYFYSTADFNPGTGTANLTPVGFYDIFFAKYDANGNYLWAKSIGSILEDQGNSIAVDDSGNVYITGFFSSTTDFDPGAGTANLTPVGSSDIFFAKYDANGNYLWAKSIGSTLGDQGNSIAVDAASGGNVYITGFFGSIADFDPGAGTANLTPVGNYDIFFAKYDETGNYLWAKNIGSTSSDWGYCLAVDPAPGGNVYLTGFFDGTADFDPGAGTANLTPVGFSDIFFAKYNASGNYLWAKSIGSISTDRGYSITVDVSGNVYLTGYFGGTADFDPGADTVNLILVGNFDIFFTKYDANGNYLWAKNIGSTGSDWGYCIAVDPAPGENVYITGFFSGTTDFDPGVGAANLTPVGNSDIFFAEYDANGNFQWAKSIGSINNDEGTSIAVDGSGNVYTKGYFGGTADFDPGAGTSNLTPVGSGDIFFAKYAAMVDIREYQNTGFGFYIYPNPINDEFIVRFENTFLSPIPISLAIFNTLSQPVWQQQVTAPETRITVSGLPKGIYILKASSEKEALYRKLVVQ